VCPVICVRVIRLLEEALGLSGAPLRLFLVDVCRLARALFDVLADLDVDLVELVGSLDGVGLGLVHHRLQLIHPERLFNDDLVLGKHLRVSHRQNVRRLLHLDAPLNNEGVLLLLRDPRRPHLLLSDDELFGSAGQLLLQAREPLRPEVLHVLFQ